MGQNILKNCWFAKRLEIPAQAAPTLVFHPGPAWSPGSEKEEIYHDEIILVWKYIMIYHNEEIYHDEMC